MTQQTKLRGVSRREFARRDGCSETLVRRGVRQGRLSCYPDGSLDPGLAGSGWRARVCADFNANTRDDGPRAAELPHLAYGNALAESARWRAATVKLEYETRDAACIGRDVAEMEFHSAWSAVRDSWRAWPARVAPIIAAQLGIENADHLEVVLSRYVAALLDELREPEELFTLL